MHHGNIFSGASFRSAILALVIFLVILLALGAVLYQSVTYAMQSELQWQIGEDVSLLETIFRDGGEAALLDDLKSLNSVSSAGSVAIGFFDATGAELGGNLAGPPGFMGWGTIRYEAGYPSPNGTYRLHAGQVGDNILVVGRNTRLIDETADRLVEALLIAGAVISVVTFVIGYLSSRVVFGKLETLVETLGQVSTGDTITRLPVSPANDQIDRISARINVHLDRLSTLTQTTKNTISAIAHDLRMPLNRAFLALQSIPARIGDKGEGDAVRLRSRVDEASGELSKLTEIFDTILNISKIQSASGQTGFEQLLADDLACEMVETFEPVLDGTSRHLSFEAEEGADLAISGDRRMLRQMLANLIENAATHCPEGATIVVAAQRSETGGVELEVRDDGPGIPEASRTDVLKPFHRLDSSRTTPGTGFGLALVNAIATRHGARITLSDNKPGLSVNIRFPPVPVSSA